MPDTKNRKFKILGAGWLGIGGLALAVVLLALVQFAIAWFQFAQGNAPSPVEVEDGFWNGPIFVLVFLVVGSICLVNGLALLRRNPMARPVLATSSLVLLIPSAILVPLLGVVAPSLWVTLSRGGKEAFESYMARENG